MLLQLGRHRGRPETLQPVPVGRETAPHRRGQVALQPVPDRIGHPQHERIEAGRDQRHADDDLVHRAGRIAGEADVHERDHVCELANLRESEPGLDRILDLLPGEEGHREAVEALPAQHEQREPENRGQVTKARHRIDEQADGHEEHGREHVPQRRRKFVQTLVDVARCAEDADEEGAHRERVVELERDEGDEEAASEQRQQQRLVVLHRRDAVEEARHVDEAEHEHADEEDAQPPEGQRHGARAHAVAVRHARDQRDDRDAEDVLADRRAEDVAHERASTPLHLLDRLREQRGRRVADGRAQEEARHRAPAQEVAADRVAEPDHHHRVEQRGRHGDVLDLLHLPRAELESEREHEEHDAELADRVDGLGVHEEAAAPGVLAHEHACQDVAEHLRQAEAGEDDRDDAHRGHHDREILEKRALVHPFPAVS